MVVVCSELVTAVETGRVGLGGEIVVVTGPEIWLVEYLLIYSTPTGLCLGVTVLCSGWLISEYPPFCKLVGITWLWAAVITLPLDRFVGLEELECCVWEILNGDVVCDGGAREGWGCGTWEDGYSCEGEGVGGCDTREGEGGYSCEGEGVCGCDGEGEWGSLDEFTWFSSFKYKNFSP